MILTALNANDLVIGCDSATTSRSNSCISLLRSFDKKTGIIKFITKSSGSKNQWNQLVRLLDLDAISETLDDIKSFDDLITKHPEIRESDILVDCDCPSYIFGGFKYINTEFGTALKPENRPPLITNEAYAGVLCKHLISALNEYLI